MPARLYMIAYCNSEEHPKGLPWIDISTAYGVRDAAAMDHVTRTGHVVRLDDFIGEWASLEAELRLHYEKGHQGGTAVTDDLRPHPSDYSSGDVDMVSDEGRPEPPYCG